jgi:choline dehydrogenase-like flavoprotein
MRGGKLTLRVNSSVRRISMDEAGRARALVVRDNASGREEEHAAKIIVVAAGAIESARLLLLSKDSRHPDGVGNSSGMVGRNLVFHHYYSNVLWYREPIWAGRLGPPTGQSQQFLAPEGRGRHGGVKVDFHSWATAANPWERTSGGEILADFERMKRSKQLGLHAESTPSAQKYVALAEVHDRFGDPFARVHYDCSDFDFETHRYSRSIFDKFLRGSGAADGEFTEDPKLFSSGAHHMGTCRMGADPKTSVVDSFGKVHGVANLFVAGGSTFVGGSGGVHPTLTMSALALRTADYLVNILG